MGFSMRKISLLMASAWLFLSTSTYAAFEDLDVEVNAEQNCDDEKFIYFHHINYFLPYYKSSNLNYFALPDGITELKNKEFKAQLSFKVPLARKIFKEKIHFFAAYTQFFYWQIYVASPYFRDTNYNPELFVDIDYIKHFPFRLGIDHLSNGRGNNLERSWNRIYLESRFEYKNFTLAVKPWVSIFNNGATERFNPDITHFLGHDKITIGYKSPNLYAIWFEITNIESGLRRGHQILNFSYKLKDYVYLYAQVFNGYGQSLIDYNQRSTAYGIGFSFSPGI